MKPGFDSRLDESFGQSVLCEVSFWEFRTAPLVIYFYLFAFYLFNNWYISDRLNL